MRDLLRRVEIVMLTTFMIASLAAGAVGCVRGLT